MMDQWCGWSLQILQSARRSYHGPGTALLRLLSDASEMDKDFMINGTHGTNACSTHVQPQSFIGFVYRFL